MRTFIKLVIVYVILAILMYCGTAFFVADFNPAHWTADQRTGVILAPFAIEFFLLMFGLLLGFI